MSDPGRSEDKRAKIRKAVGQRLREARVKLNLTQPELAELLGIKRQTLASWEAGTTAPEVTSLCILREVAKNRGVNIDVADLFGDGKPDWTGTPFSFTTKLLQTIDSLGVRGMYSNRGEAMLAFLPFIEREETMINLVASSFLGIRTVAPGRVPEVLRGKARLIRILMTHPEISQLREDQEGRRPGSIMTEISESVETLKAWGVFPENIRFYKGAPTVFLMYTSERMLVNPYPYSTEAFKTMTIEVAPTPNSEAIYAQYALNHMERPWGSTHAITLDKVDLKPKQT